MGILDFFKRKKKTQDSIDIHIVADEKPAVSSKIGKAWGELLEFNDKTVTSLQSRFFAFDVETTGLSPQLNRIVELGV